MPRKCEWLLRVPEILGDLCASDLPVLDRATVEVLFRLGRRRSIDLIASFGGYQAGRTYLIRREVLIARLQEIAGSEAFRYEHQRKQRLAEALDEVRRYRRTARVRIAPAPAQASSLPDGVALAPGRMVIAFRSVEDLLQQLYAMTQAAARDYEEFEKVVSGVLTLP